MCKFALFAFSLFIASIGNCEMYISPPTGLMGVVGATGSVPYYSGTTWVTGATGITYNGTTATFNDTLTASKGISVSTIQSTGNIISYNADAAHAVRVGTNDTFYADYLYSGISATNMPITLNTLMAQDINFKTNNTDAMVIKSGGSVGIGTTAPDSKLSISSSTASTSFMSFLGSMTKAEILAFDPVQAGQTAYCTDCTTSMHCTSTGTAVTQFADIGDRTAACN